MKVPAMGPQAMETSSAGVKIDTQALLLNTEDSFEFLCEPSNLYLGTKAYLLLDLEFC